MAFFLTFSEEHANMLQASQNMWLRKIFGHEDEVYLLRSLFYTGHLLL